MAMLKNQNIPQKPCPLCKTGKIYTGERGKALNVQLDGVSVCEDCVVEALKERYAGGLDGTICLSCGNDVEREGHWESCPILDGE